MKRYLSAIKYAAFVLGNSSSGILEAPVMGVPAVNIGDRQRVRWMPEAVINCEPGRGLISRAMESAELIGRRILDLKKGFYDVKEVLG